jgi:uncharacterized protein YbcI
MTAEGFGPSATEISNLVVAFQKEQFDRGPDQARAYLADALVICLMRGVLTAAERCLVEAGRGEAVRETRSLIGAETDRFCVSRMESLLDRPVVLRTTGCDPGADRAVEVYLLG